MPLREGQRPLLQESLYYTGDGAAPWSPDWRRAKLLFEHAVWTSVSLTWLEGPRRWIFLYSHADDVNKFDKPVVARVGTTPWNWSHAVELFNPHRERAYGVYMHKVNTASQIHPDIPPSQDPGAKPHDGWAYGAYLLNRFTEWDEARRELGIYYLLSLSSPYQVQLMHARLSLG